MLIYLIIVCFLLFSFFFNVDKNEKSKKRWLIFTFLILTFVSAIRSYTVGVDTSQYYSAFKVITGIEWEQFKLTRYEIGFFYLNKIISLFSNNPQSLLIITSIIIIPSVGYIIYKYSNNVVFSTLLYVLLNIFFFHMTGMRQSIAISILLFSIPLLEKKKYLKFCFMVVLASLFHSSSIIFLLAIILDKIKYNNKNIIYIILITAFCFIFLKPIFIYITGFLGKYAGYATSEDFGVSNYFGALFQFLLTLATFIFCNFMFIKFEKKDKSDKRFNYDEFFLKMLSLDVIFQCMAMKMNIIGRMNQFFWIYAIIIIPNLIAKENKAKTRLMLYIGIIFIALVYWLIIGIYRPEWNGAIPYSVFNNN